MGLNLRHSDYLEENSYDRLRLAAFWEMSAFFRTQTTLRLTLGMNYLFFPHIITEITASVAAAAMLQEAATSIAVKEPQYRRGNPEPSPPAPPAPPPPPPSPPAPPTPPEPQPEPEPQAAVVSSTAALTIPQPFVVFRIAQGLGYKTGLIAEIQFRKNQNQVQSLEAMIINEWALQQMDEDFFWQGTRLSLAFRTEAVLKTEIAADFSLFYKQYNGIEALDMAGDPILPRTIREDKMAQIILKIAKSFGRFGFYITGSFRRNISNDLYFRYNFYTIAAGLDLVI